MNNASMSVGSMYSTLCTEELLIKVAPMFEIPKPISCEFLCQGVNDSYKIITASGAYLLRIYRKGWRTRSDIGFELNVLNHLQNEGVDVSFPVLTISGDQVLSLSAAEGKRFAIMTHFAEGKPLSYDEESDATLYGKAAAKIHQCSDGFTSHHKRFELDLPHLIDVPLSRIQPFFKDRKSDWNFLENYASELSASVSSYKLDSLDMGFCHGDFHSGNAHVLDGDLTFFDFDCCGVGYRAYDLAVFKWNARLVKKEEERWTPFINAYREVREISDADLKLVDFFVSIRHIWLMGLHADIIAGRGYLNDAYFTRQIKFLKDAREERHV